MRRALDQLDQPLHRRLGRHGLPRSPDLRSLTSTSPLFRPFGPTISWNGRPIRSMVANLPPGALVGVVVEHRDAGLLELAVEVGARRVGILVARLEVDQPHLERRHRHRPDDARLVVAGLDDGRRQAATRRCRRSPSAPRSCCRPAPARGTPWARSTWCRRRKYGRSRCRAPTRACPAGTSRLEAGRIVLLVGRRVVARPLPRSAARDRASKSMSAAGHARVQQVGVAKDLALAGLGQDDELVAEVAADRAPSRPPSGSTSAPCARTCAGRPRTSCCRRAAPPPGVRSKE